MNKKRFVFAALLTFLVSMAGCGNSSASDKVTKNTPGNSPSVAKGTSEPEKAESGDTLIVYFTGTGNTEKIATTVAEVVQGDLYKIEPETPYTSEDLNYNDDNCRANKEMQDASARPKIAGTVKNMEKYHIIYLGYPIWWGTAPKIINTFMGSYGDLLNGKTIVTFCTSGSSAINKSNEELKSTYPKVNWVEGQRFKTDDSKSEIEDWIKSVK